MASTLEPADGLPDDRITCRTCEQFAPGGSWCRWFKWSIAPHMVDVPRRCTGYYPLMSERDRRPGSQRWPNLVDAPKGAGAPR